jgi:integrase
MSQVGVTPAKEQEPVCTHLAKRGSRYSIRRKVPVDLQGHYGRSEIVKALGTSDRREAEQLCRVAGAKLDEEFAGVRAALTAAPSASPAASAPTQDTPATSPATDTPIRINADEVASRTLGLLRQRRDAAAGQGYEALAAFHERMRRGLDDQEAILCGDLEPFHPLSKHEGHRNALRAFLTGDGSVKELPEQIAHGQPAQDAQTVSLVQPAQLGSPTRPTPPTAFGGHTLQEIADKWVKERAPIKRTVGQAQKVIGRYVEHMGDTKVEQITRRNVVEFKDKLLESGQTAVNTNKQLTLLSTLLNFAAKNSIIEQNPATGVNVEVRKNAKEARLPFDIPALRALFSSPVYALGERPKGGAGEAGYWLPLLALFTGARIEELCQLRPDDVYEETYRELDGSVRSAWVLRITDEGPGQALKNPGSRRRIPIHAELIRLGFTEHVRQAKGRNRIFDKLVKDTVGDESGNWSKWFGGYLREKAGVSDKRMVFHSFRHTFKHEARAMEIPEDVSDAITGHAGGKVSRNYGGTDYPLRPLVEAMNRFQITGFVPPKPPAA